MIDRDALLSELAADQIAVSELFPGAGFRTVIGWLHQALRPRTYLEIGIKNGTTLRLAQPPTRAVGVDPRPMLFEPPPANTTVVTATSDAFFADGHAARHFSDTPIDLAFIDGLHLAEQVVADFENVLRYMAAGGVVLLHDVMPVRAGIADRQRHTIMWTGDVWKAGLAILACWPGLEARLVRCAPSGLLLIRVGPEGAATAARPVGPVVRALLPRRYDEAAIRELSAIATLDNTKEAVVAYAHERPFGAAMPAAAPSGPSE